MRVSLCRQYLMVHDVDSIGGFKMVVFRRCFFLLVLLASMWSIAMASPSSARRSDIVWKYSTFFLDPSFKVNDRAYPTESLIIKPNPDDSKQATGHFADMVIPMQLKCSNRALDKVLYCIKGAGVTLTFAVPKHFPNGPKKWSLASFDFYLFSKQPMHTYVLGEEVTVWLIKARNPYDPRYEFEYLYSIKRGLIAYGSIMLGGGTVGTFHWLVSSCGFAARDCHSHK